MFGTRYYDPSIGRWAQQDPLAGALADPGTLNRYAYVGADPVNAVDPSGYSTCGDFSIGGLVDCAANPTNIGATMLAGSRAAISELVQESRLSLGPPTLGSSVDSQSVGLRVPASAEPLAQ